MASSWLMVLLMLLTLLLLSTLLVCRAAGLLEDLPALDSLQDGPQQAVLLPSDIPV